MNYRKILTTTLITLSLFCGSSFAQTTEGLIGWYECEGTSNTTLIDSSGNGYHGTLGDDSGNRRPSRVAGKIGKAMEFIDTDFITLPPELFSDVSNQVTISLWQYGDSSLTGEDRHMLIDGSRGSDNTTIALSLRPGSKIQFNCGNGDNLNRATSMDSQYKGQWNNYIATKDKNSGEVKIYVNGKLFHSSNTMTGGMSGIDAVRLGRRCGNNQEYYQGLLDDIRIYNRVLSQVEINALAGIKQGAYDLVPVDGGFIARPARLEWTCDVEGSTFDVYLSSNYNDVSNRNASALVSSGSNLHNYMAIWTQPGVTYYWTVDAYNSKGTHIGDEILSFTQVEDGYASIPTPMDKESHFKGDKLSWVAGGGTISQDVYFSTDYFKVESRDESVLIANDTTASSVEVGTLVQDETYYWVVDTTSNEGINSQGVWSFTVNDPYIPSSLVGWWKFNEPVGSMALDFSGYGHHGAIVGASRVEDSIMGPVLDFEGVDYVAIPAAAFSEIDDQVTIALWQYGDVSLQPQNDSIFYGSDSSGYRVLNCHLPFGNSRVTWDAGNSGGSSYDRIYKTVTADQYAGRWNHWAFTKDAASGQMEIYLNGQLWHSGSSNTKTMAGITTFKIGSYSDGGNNYDGKIYDFRVYNEKLSADEIEELADVFTASNQLPKENAWDVDPYPTLSWDRGYYACNTGGHDLYLGTDEDLVKNRSSSVYKGRFDSPSYTPGMLTLATTYYWAVDEISHNDSRSPWKGDVWKFTTRNSTEGYVADLMFHGGAGLSTTYPHMVPCIADGLTPYSIHVLDSGGQTYKVFHGVSSGELQDDNPLFLYPDREPRYRMMMGFGGSTDGAADALGSSGKANAHDFWANGGSYCGSCAGGYLAKSKHFNTNPVGGAPANTGGGRVNLSIPDGKTPLTHLNTHGYDEDQRDMWTWDVWGTLPKSPIADLYPEVFGDYMAFGPRMAGGPKGVPWANDWNQHIEHVEALFTFDLTMCLDTDTRYKKYGFFDNMEDPFDYSDPLGLLVNRLETAGDRQVKAHNACNIWSYKVGDYTGRSNPSGGHSETDRWIGENKYIQAASFRYAFAGFGRHNVKAELSDGLTRYMNDNSTAGHEKIGDMQYHHFTIKVPENTSTLEISLDGDKYDMNLYAKRGDFAFLGEQGVFEPANGTGANEVLTIENPTSGTWFIGVKMNTGIDTGGAEYPEFFKDYKGRLDLLNGIGYEITASVKTQANGDLNLDDSIDYADLKIMTENWLTDNSHIRTVRDLIGWWDFTQISNGFAQDLSGFNNDAALLGDTFAADGVMNFDGSDDYLQTALSDTALELTDAYTIYVKLNPAPTQVSGAGIIAKTELTAGIPQSHWSLNFGFSDTLGYIIAMNGPYVWNTGISLDSIAQNWHDVAVVFGGGFISSYLDGNKIKSEEFQHLPLNGNGVLKIGCDRMSYRFYNGQIDDLKIYDYELNSDEIQQLHQLGYIFEEQELTLLAKWDFDSGNANDSSGNGYDGTVHGAQIVNDPEKGKVLLLDGVDDYVDLPSVVLDSITNEITMSFWQYGGATSDNGNHHYLVGSLINDGSISNMYRVFMPTKNKTIQWVAGRENIASDASVSQYKGQWNYWVMTKDTVAGEMKIYLNGQIFCSSFDRDDPMTQVDVLRLGASGEGSDFYDGMVDDFRIYGRVLSQQEISDIYNNIIPVDPDVICSLNPTADLNSDCKVNFADFVILAENWLK